jgi:hypothetical protein
VDTHPEVDNQDNQLEEDIHEVDTLLEVDIPVVPRVVGTLGSRVDLDTLEQAVPLELGQEQAVPLELGQEQAVPLGVGLELLGEQVIDRLEADLVLVQRLELAALKCTQGQSLGLDRCHAL